MSYLPQPHQHVLVKRLTLTEEDRASVMNKNGNGFI